MSEHRIGESKNYQDLSGMVFGRLSVICFAGINKHNKALWKCVCQCGKEEIVLAATLKRKNGISMACEHFGDPDFIGKTFGKLTVVSFFGLINQRRYWNCVCECGGNKVAQTNSLTRFDVQSCGCLQKPLVQEKFWDRVVRKSNGCWEWIGARTVQGYGQMIWETGNVVVHRLVYSLYCNAIPKGLYVCHHCDNPPCCRPDHLFLGTHQDNVDDMVSKDRQASGERNGFCTRLTKESVRKIRKRYSEGGITQKQLSVENNCSRSLIQVVVRNLAWKKVE